jgi:hypothetical protein
MAAIWGRKMSYSRRWPAATSSFCGGFPMFAAKCCTIVTILARETRSVARQSRELTGKFGA